MKLINEIFLLRLGSTALEYAGFVQLIIQISIHIHRKGRMEGVSIKQAQGMMMSHMVLNCL